MSSSTFIQRWTSVNDLTTTTTTTKTNSKNNKQSTPFFLRPQLAPPPPPPSSSLSTLRPSQSLISLIDSSSSSSKIRCQSTKNTFISPRIAKIIDQFESQTISLMNNSSPIRSIFVKQWEGTKSPRNTPIVIVETSSPIPFHRKKPQPIIICERITNHNRPISSPIIKTWSQLKIPSQQQQILDQHSETLSRSSTSGTTDSTCSTSSSSSLSNISSPPRFARPTIASTQKQRQFLSHSLSFKRSSSPPSSITTFTRAIPPIFSSIVPLCSINEDLEQQIPTPTLSKLFFFDKSSFINNTNSINWKKCQSTIKIQERFLSTSLWVTFLIQLIILASKINSLKTLFLSLSFIHFLIDDRRQLFFLLFHHVRQHIPLSSSSSSFDIKLIRFL